MTKDVFKILEKDGAVLATMSAPRPGDWMDGDIRALANQGITVVVSLLEADEIARLNLQQEPSACDRHKIELISFPMPDHGVPGSVIETAELAVDLHNRLRRGQSIAIHCLAGIGRSSIIAASVLLQEGFSVEESLETISVARGFPVPENDAQLRWLKDNRLRIAPPTKPLPAP